MPGAHAAGGSPRSTASLNERLKDLNLGANVDYSPHRVVLGDAQGVFAAAMSAYEAKLAPPPDILRRTFGFIYHRRSASAPDSLAYVYDTYAIGPLTMCKAWKITEHPYQAVREVGSVAGNAGIGGAVVTPANSPVVRHDDGGTAEVETIQFPCTEKSYTPVARGSLTTPLPRHPDLPTPAISPVPGATSVSPAPSSAASAGPAPPFTASFPRRLGPPGTTSGAAISSLAP